MSSFEEMFPGIVSDLVKEGYPVRRGGKVEVCNVDVRLIKKNCVDKAVLKKALNNFLEGMIIGYKAEIPFNRNNVNEMFKVLFKELGL